MTACIVCGCDEWRPRWEILLRCRDCGFMRAADMPEPAVAAGLYTAEYFQGEEYGDYLADREVHRRNFARRWRDMQQVAGQPRAVFEIGCAYGLWLEFLSEQGVRAAGVDVCAEPVRYAVEQLGQDARLGDFVTMDLAPGEFDAFCLWDTIEHLAHPEQVVARIAEAAPRDGWLFLTTGDIGSRLARWRGRRWRLIHPPTHLQYFSRETLRRFLARHGFTVRESTSAPQYRTLHSVLASQAALGRGWSRSLAQGLNGWLPSRLQQRAGVWTDLGDIMFVAARKE